MKKIGVQSCCCGYLAPPPRAKSYRESRAATECGGLVRPQGSVSGELGAGARDAVDAARRLCARVSRDSSPRRRRRQRTGQRSDATRPPPINKQMGTPVLVGEGRRGKAPLVGAAVDLGLQFGSDGIQRLLEVRVVATTVRLLEPLPG